MLRDLALKVLLKRQPAYSIVNNGTIAIEELGSSIWTTSLNNQASNMEKIRRSQEFYADTMDFDFSPLPSKPTVIRIYHAVCYNCGRDNKIISAAPSVENFLHSLTEKIGSSKPTKVETRFGGEENDIYVWTRAGELLSAAELQRRLKYPATCISPPKLNGVRTNTGIYFHGMDNLTGQDPNYRTNCGTVMQVDWTQERGVITHFSIELNDVAGLISAISKSSNLVDAKSARQHQQELQHANQNRPDL